MNISTLRSMPHLSASSIQSYNGCGLQYKFSRVEKATREFTSDNLIFGSTIHQVLSDYNEEKLIGNPLSAQELMDLFENYWTANVNKTPDIRYSRGKNFDVLLKQGKEMIKTFISQVPKDEYEILAVEEPFRFNIDDIDIPIIGIMDLVERDESNTIIISDYKTMSSSVTINEIDQNFQLSVYYLAAKKNGYANNDIVLKLDCLMKTKTPQFKQIYTHRSDDDEKRTIKIIKETWNGIQKEVFLPNGQGTWKCNYCEFANQCREYLLN
ncbi:conserved hypothetical protein [Desulfamplus magnetovallimortis]|uniref:PD-(D/E)XK endonuclease-like domain-containing protein n=1 Tax=Desulfamplus magnetovallimortis TaxID=1246637 RepID=A0A1W1HEU0_9BACT|nr:PD-(D/E)XK nuclease family protein [Desulfamplus magnetovallimortis]SLM30918.1 conserved hypothetical protein [Desulfamplus magnetovallimortis]